MVIVRNPEFHIAQPVFINFPDVNEFASKDLFAPHPTKPSLWKYVSRWDDIIVFSNGEKLQPVTFESSMMTSPDIKGCIVIGQGRFQAILLLEPQDPTMATTDLVSKAWPYVQLANASTVKHGRIARDCILVTQPEKPLPRAGKGTIQRATANQIYPREIDDFYTSLQQDGANVIRSRIAEIDMSDVEATESSLIQLLQQDLDAGNMSGDDDFFAFGMDSLQVINLVRVINGARPAEAIDAKSVYDHPTMSKLAHFLHEQSSTGYDYDDDSDDEELKQSWLAMDELYSKMTARQPSPGGKAQNFRRFAPLSWLRSSSSGPVIQPDGGRVAWSQVLAMFLVNLNNWGLVNSFGVFQTFYETKLLANHSPSEIAWIGTLQGALLLIIGVVSGPLFDKGYFKVTLTAASIGLVLALMMLSVSTTYYEIMLSQGVLLGICQGLLYTPSVALVPVYFKRRRGLALGLATGGGSIGGVLYSVIFYRLLTEIGFEWAVRVVAFIAIATLGVAVILSKPLGPRRATRLFDRVAFKEVSYVAFLCSAFRESSCDMHTAMAVLTSYVVLLAGLFVPFFLVTIYSTGHLGVSASLSNYLLCVVNAAQFVGRVLPSWLSDFRYKQLGPELYLFLGEFALGILGFWWAAVHNVGGYIAWLVLYGFFSGAAITVPAIVLPFVCPNLAVYGTRIGMLYGSAGLGLLISTPIATTINTNNLFLGAQMWTGAVCLCASLLFLVTAVEARRRRLLYEMGKGGRKGRMHRQ